MSVAYPWRNAAEYCAGVDQAFGDNPEVVVERSTIAQKGVAYPYRVIRSREIGDTDRIVMIRAGIHGEEIAGPLTLLWHGLRSVDRIHAAGLKVIMVPLANPYGFEHGERHSERGPRGNDDAICYVLRDGSVVDDLGSGSNFQTWFWSHRGPADRPWNASDLPAETRMWLELFQHEWEEHPWQFVAFLDLHQDYFIKGRSGAYHYAFGDLARYERIATEIEKIVPLCKHEAIGSGCNGEPLPTNDRGFIVRHDGSTMDAAHHLGIPHAVTVETLGATPLADACRANMVWINGIIDLLAHG